MRHVLFLAVLLLGTTWALAQNDQNQTSPSDQTPAAQGDMTPTNSSGNMTVQRPLKRFGRELHVD